MICQANMYKSNERQSLRTSQIVQSALLNNKGIRSDHMGSLLQSDICNRLTMYMYSQSSRARRRERERGRPFGATVLTQVPLKGIVGRDVHLLRAQSITQSLIKRQQNVPVPPVDAGDIAPDPLAHHFNPNLYSFISLYLISHQLYHHIFISVQI